MENDNIFQLIYSELEARSFDNVAQNLKQDCDYQTASNAMVVFRMGMQYCFSLLMQLSGKK